MTYRTYADARAALERHETSCHALVSSFLRRIEARNDELNAFLEVDAEGALDRARSLDAEHAEGRLRPLAGLVLGVKDVIALHDRQLTCSSRMLASFVSLFDATAAARLLDAGAIPIGKLNCDEFAMGSSNENSAFGPVRHPDDPAYVPGGSSGGSAAAVAAGLCHAALGTDTGGSIRQPAALCGVVGLKPTYGRVSRLGLVAYASSFDCMGPLTHSVEDAAALLEVMAGVDPWDSTSAPEPVPDYRAAIGRSVEGLRVGLPGEYYTDGLDDGVREHVGRAAAALEAAGAELRPISLPHTRYGIATYYILATAEASSNLARYDGVRYGHRADLDAVRRAHADADDGEALLERFYSQTRAEGFGPEVKRRIMLGTYVLSAGYYDAYYRKAQQVRALIRRDFERAWEQVDVLLTPATPAPAFKIGEKTADPLEMYLSDIYTVTANLAGIPGLVVPVGRHTAPPHLPVGVQLLGAPFSEEMLFRVGDAVMRHANTGT